MEKWTNERIKAHKQYVENNKCAIKRWETSLNEHKEGIKRAENMIKFYKEDMLKTINELAEQGVMI